MKPNVTKNLWLAGALFVFMSIVSMTKGLAWIGFVLFGIGLIASFVPYPSLGGSCNWWWVRGKAVRQMPPRDIAVLTWAEAPLYITTRGVMTCIAAGFTAIVADGFHLEIPGFPWVSGNLLWISITLNLIAIGLGVLKIRSDSHTFWQDQRFWRRLNDIPGLP